jgi:transglutaminase-like putative cysteine protease
MNRRHFLQCTSAISGLALTPAIFRSAGPFSPAEAAEAPWQHFELVTKVTLDPARGRSRVWLPIPTHVQLDHQRPLTNTWKGNFSNAGIFREPLYGCEALYAEWDEQNAKAPKQLELTSTVSVRDRTTDLKKPREAATGIPEDVALYLKGTPSSPTDGIVLATAQKIAKPDQPPMQKAQAVYDWILENGVRDPNVTGCGTGDVIAMLETGNISGKCADLNGLFVALVRSLGVPARDVYGIRAADSRFFKSLGKSGEITKAQHCKAEFYAAEFGWVPVDPADVLKVALEERVSMESPQIASERLRQFGMWEGNWVTYNTARDVRLNPAAKAEVEFLMYPRAETEQGILNHLDPKSFHYEITSRPVQA